MSQSKIFETERLILRPTLEQDADLIYQVLNTPKFKKFVGDRKINSIEDAKTYIKIKMLPQLHKLGYSNYSLILKSSGDKVGICGLYDRDGIEGVDIGFGLLPQYEGLGFAYESSQKLIQLAFQELDIKEINAITSKENFSSQKLLEKLGLKVKGITKLPNDEKELLLYKIVK